MPSILVAYATKYGSTREIAEVAAESLREEGLSVTLSTFADAAPLDDYSAIVIGAALYNHKWHRDAVRFVSRNQAKLSRVPVAVFAVGPVNRTAEEFDSARQQLDHVLSRWQWLTPVAVTVFGGRFDPMALHFPGASRIMSKVPASDALDPSAIRAWSHSLPAAFALEPATVR